MQAREILIALAIVQIERGMLTLVRGTLGLAHHHVGLGAATGTNSPGNDRDVSRQ